MMMLFRPLFLHGLCLYVLYVRTAPRPVRRTPLGHLWTTYPTSWSSWLPRSPPSLGFPCRQRGSLGGVYGSVVVVVAILQNQVLDPTVPGPGEQVGSGLVGL